MKLEKLAAAIFKISKKSSLKISNTFLSIYLIDEMLYAVTLFEFKYTNVYEHMHTDLQP